MQTTVGVYQRPQAADYGVSGSAGSFCFHLRALVTAHACGTADGRLAARARFKFCEKMPIADAVDVRSALSRVFFVFVFCLVWCLRFDIL
jgi:hypothetical protein